MKQIEFPETNPCLCENLIYDRCGIVERKGKDGLFNKLCWDNCYGKTYIPSSCYVQKLILVQLKI